MKCNDINKIYRTANIICSIMLSFMALSYCHKQEAKGTKLIITSLLCQIGIKIWRKIWERAAPWPWAHGASRVIFLGCIRHMCEYATPFCLPSRPAIKVTWEGAVREEEGDQGPSFPCCSSSRPAPPQHLHLAPPQSRPSLLLHLQASAAPSRSFTSNPLPLLKLSHPASRATSTVAPHRLNFWGKTRLGRTNLVLLDGLLQRLLPPARHPPPTTIRSAVSVREPRTRWSRAHGSGEVEDDHAGGERGRQREMELRYFDQS
jgi:hypothetical protein